MVYYHLDSNSSISSFPQVSCDEQKAKQHKSRNSTQRDCALDTTEAHHESNLHFHFYFIIRISNVLPLYLNCVWAILRDNCAKRWLSGPLS